MTQHVSVSAPVSFAPGVGDPRPVQPARPVQPSRPDRGHGQTGFNRQSRPWSKKTATQPGDRWQRRDDPPETQPVAAILRQVPPHHSYHRLSGVAATLDRISQLKRITVDDPVGR